MIEVAEAYEGSYIFNTGRRVPVLNNLDFSEVYFNALSANNQV